MSLECAVTLGAYDAVTMGHGGGGRLMQRLIDEIVVPELGGGPLAELGDSALVPWAAGRLALTTDSYVVTPPFFPGGDIGTLAVHGTANDLAMAGARPRFLSLGLILEEGFLLADLRRVLRSIRAAADPLGLRVVTGDTKVVERGKADRIFVNTTGIGEVREDAESSPRRVRAGDRIVLSGAIAEHGMAVLSVRESLGFEGDLRSDTAALWPLVERLLDTAGRDVHAMRDATRGGVASVLNEIARAAGVGMMVEEGAIPVRPAVRAACEVLGLDPLYVANEGRFVGFLPEARVAAALAALRGHPLGADAVVIGEVVAEHPGVVRMRGGLGGTRVLDLLSGEQLPRIC